MSHCQLLPLTVKWYLYWLVCSWEQDGIILECSWGKSAQIHPRRWHEVGLWLGFQCLEEDLGPVGLNSCVYLLINFRIADSFADIGCLVEALLVVEGSSATGHNLLGRWEAVWGTWHQLAVDLSRNSGLMQSWCKLRSFHNTASTSCEYSHMPWPAIC